MFNLFKKKIDHAQEIALYYDEWTPKYMDGFGDIFQSNQADDLELFFKYYIQSIGLKEGDLVADAGCGIGGPAIHIAQHIDVHIDAVTISKEQVTIAQNKVKAANLSDRINILEADFHKMNSVLKQEHYDTVYFMESLVHSKTPKVALAQAYSLLKRTGTLYIKDLFKKTAYHPAEIEIIDKWVAHNNKAMYLNIIPKEEILMMARDLGFMLVFCKLIEIPTNQDLGNAWAAKNEVMPNPETWAPYLEWYEMKFVKPNFCHKQ